MFFSTAVDARLSLIEGSRIGKSKAPTNATLGSAKALAGRFAVPVDRIDKALKSTVVVLDWHSRGKSEFWREEELIGYKTIFVCLIGSRQTNS